jgi:hypothetical protein
MDTIFNEVCLLATAAFALTLVPGFSRPERSFHLIHREWFGLARGYAYRCRRTIAIAAIMPKGIRMKSAMRMPIAKPFASGDRPGGTATNRVSQSSSFMVPSELRLQYTDIAGPSHRIWNICAQRQIGQYANATDSMNGDFFKRSNSQSQSDTGTILENAIPACS